jgi:hypothetical protein
MSRLVLTNGEGLVTGASQKMSENKSNFNPIKKLSGLIPCE